MLKAQRDLVCLSLMILNRDLCFVFFATAAVGYVREEHQI